MAQLRSLAGLACLAAASQPVNQLARALTRKAAPFVVAPLAPRLCSTSGPNLRRLYLPGMEGLKAELRKLDFLMERFLPSLTAHLNVSSAPAGAPASGAAAALHHPEPHYTGGHGQMPVGRPTFARYVPFPFPLHSFRRKEWCQCCMPVSGC